MLTTPIRGLVAQVNEADAAEGLRKTGDQMFELNALIATASSFYEKLRYMVDYRDEHTIRRNAIERILKRHTLIEGNSVHGDELLRELVNGRYLPKEEASEALAEEMGIIATRYIELGTRSKVRNSVMKQLLSFAATEIDSRLSPLHYALDEAVIKALFETLRGRIVAPAPESKIDEQLFCAAWRALLSGDDERIAYALWQQSVPGWVARKDTADIAPRVVQITEQVRAALKDDLQWQIAPKIKNESIYFRIIRELVQDKKGVAADVLADKKEMEDYARTFLAQKYKKENERIRSSGIRAVLYLFVTKVAVALAVEVPYELFFLGAVNTFALGINILFHPLLLLLLTRRVGELDNKNTEAILAGLRAVIFDDDSIEQSEASHATAVRKRAIGNRYPRLNVVFGVLYLILFMLVFGTVVLILTSLGFDTVSIMLFLFFLALVSYFAFRIRYQARRWKVSSSNGVIGMLAVLLAVPVIETGRWLSQKFSSLNIFVLILDFIIEMPFKKILHFSDAFIFYLRDKAEEIQ